MRPNDEQSRSRADVNTRVRRVVLFDFDGVLIRGDAFSMWLRHRFATAWWLIVPLLLTGTLLLPAASTRQGRRLIVRWGVTLALVGLDEATYRDRAGQFGRAIARDARKVSGAALAALNVHRESGDRVLVVTGCEETLARSILDELGLASIELVASRIAQGRFGLRVTVRNVGREKLRQLALRDILPVWDVAYSDSSVDLPMLEGSRSAVLVNFRGSALAHAQARLGDRLTTVAW